MILQYSIIKPVTGEVVLLGQLWLASGVPSDQILLAVDRWANQALCWVKLYRW